ncbi:FHA domain-containing protein (plasmid) [Arthrobacter sp. YA7-1]|uniref:FHA domain-containing protein n=1 Tax=Arthrobacter sp. YA7-1 TaxID=2987701 RepID=UPI002225E043|nr:FHA domain-containing protein [Arthrobacter sp. YA7-1]UYY83568.1 FHA domain-containing protein [Arthrobacter sp. YA7-1]
MADQVAVLTVFAVLVAAGFAGGIGLCWYMYRNESVASPLRLLASRISWGRVEEPANYARLTRSIRAGLRRAYTIDIGGSRSAAGVLSVYVAPEARDELSRHEVADLHEQIARAYAREALRAGWRHPPEDQLTVYVVVDESRYANHARVDSRRPNNGQGSCKVVDLRAETISSGVAPVMDGGPSVTKELGDDTTVDYSGTTATLDDLASEDTNDPHDLPGSHEESTAADPERALVTNGGVVLGRVTVSGMKIGRSSETDLLVDDRSVSRYHAILKTEGHDLVLIPEPGRRCFVNGVLIQGPTMVNPGDKLKFARSPKVFTIEGGRG